MLTLSSMATKISYGFALNRSIVVSAIHFSQPAAYYLGTRFPSTLSWRAADGLSAIGIITFVQQWLWDLGANVVPRMNDAESMPKAKRYYTKHGLTILQNGGINRAICSC
jgi:hypothetical protein